jgi:hypothetical protein
MAKSSKLLINEPPLQVLPTLASLLGLNESIVLQQIQYWLYLAETTEKIGIYRNGRWWIFNNLDKWHKSNFPFWSTRTIQRILDNLREKRVVIVGRLSINNLDQTLYYTIDYDRLDCLLMGEELIQEPAPITTECLNGAPFSQVVQMDIDNLSSSITTSCLTVNSLTEITSETTQRVKPLPFTSIQIWQMIDQQLEGEMNRGNYYTYVRPLKAGEITPDNTLVLSAPDQITAAWVSSHLGKTISRLVEGITMAPAHLQVIV